MAPGTRPAAVLLVTAIPEHGAEDAASLRQLLPVATVAVTTGEEALQRLTRARWHGCVVDFLLEDMSGLELLRRLRDVASLRQPPLCLAGSDLARDQQLEAVSLGACALLVRPCTVAGMALAVRRMDALRECHAREAGAVAQSRQALRREDFAAALRCFETWQPLLPGPDAIGTSPASEGSRLRGASLQLFVQGCNALVQDRLDDAGLALAMSRKTAILEAEARMAMGEAHRMAGWLQAFAESAQQAHHAHQLLERMDQVAAALVEVLCYDDRLPLPLNTAGVQLRRAGELDAAELAYAVALELSPQAPGVHFNLAKTLARNSRHKEAFDEIRRALQLDPDFEEAGLLYRKITGKAWHGEGTGIPSHAAHGLRQPLLDV
ncbi:putative response regulator receiver protein [Megalodesulfovibrio gigas DSM 1382 = ATCC 19364]|uniref:Putative response regulator receiver protein n=1 Tax=Megalodesulfovibrio gigas (strain ATCC 19364 / DSM 1382 / NCIMB 9332 / VKM B-1759) TaxID=1121448 RepID=T2G920_MEGG1|nr:putative response regulator receiver protein [Megalodesulfovibrio gigas DSM 1382 = ATCC 19364]